MKYTAAILFILSIQFSVIGQPLNSKKAALSDTEKLSLEMGNLANLNLSNNQIIVNLRVNRNPNLTYIKIQRGQKFQQ